MKGEDLKWDKAYELGVEEIDLQHRYFIDLIRKLSVKLAAEGNIEYKKSLINELNAYAKFHFISEENLMMEAGYPQLDEHKQHHYQLIENLSSKEFDLLSTPSEQTLENMITFLVEWFFQHTTKEDRRVADFLMSKRNG